MKLKSIFSCLAVLASTAYAKPKPQPLTPFEIMVKQSYQECFDGKYDRDIRCLKDDFNDIYNSTLELTVMGMVIKDDPKDRSKKIESHAITTSSGLLLKDGYLLTASHINDPDLLSPEIQKIVIPKSFVTLMEYQGVGYTLQYVHGDKALDFQLVKTKEPLKNTYLPTIGNPNELRVGDAVYIVGNSLGLGISLREGIVSRLKTKSPKFVEGLINISNGANIGDSGSPIYAIRDGKFELMGICTTIGRGNNLTYFRPIDDIINSLDNAKINHPLKR